MMKIELEKFSGPLSLLLKLIEKDDLDITKISLARIADQYIDYIRRRAKINPEEMADFLIVAARLLLLKSKALLPYLYPEEEEEIEELERQLKMYKEFLDAAKKIEARLGKKKFMFAREFNRRAAMAGANLFSPPKKLTARDMAETFRDLISRLRLPEKMEEEKLDTKISIEDKILSIQQMLLKRIKVNFNKVLAAAGNKTEIIVSFLAMLELIKQKEARAEQAGLFDEIVISRLN